MQPLTGKFQRVHRTKYALPASHPARDAADNKRGSPRSLPRGLSLPTLALHVPENLSADIIGSALPDDLCCDQRLEISVKASQPSLDALRMVLGPWFDEEQAYPYGFCTPRISARLPAASLQEQAREVAL